MTPADLIHARYGKVPFDPPEEISPALAALLDRRVTRRYRAEDVPDPLLDTILAAAQSAPSKSDPSATCSTPITFTACRTAFTTAA